ncbi:hypothetical protein M407DRAFT_244268 [Tulasnella calospora MUT 4182]|uniref:Uncharacterized protein n=1 Tax=Tulasnella calospora MUT 4182 TaxID=1051891 RepID=A0A0C3QGX9_9AGAM|nr:hypothetical protein M407DRAFT_244268 [Tulasnella calospora MUT 4182]
MFFSKIVAVFAVAVAAVTVGARPLPLPLQKAGLVQRGEQVVRNMEQVVGAVTIIEKRQGNVNTVPAEIPTQSKNGVIEPFQGGDVTKRAVPVEVASKSDGAEIVPFNSKRQVDVQDAVMSDGGDIIPFKNTGKRDVAPEAEVEKRGPKINTFPTWIAARSDGGAIVAF